MINQQHYKLLHIIFILLLMIYQKIIVYLFNNLKNSKEVFGL